MKNIFLILAVPFVFVLFFGVRWARAEVRPEAPGGNAEIRGEGRSKAEDELVYKQKARKRLYPGGRDEESLRVQIQMSQPTRKMGPATEAPEPSSTSTDD